jgi:hypothetical protein
MTLQDKLKNDLKSAMKARDEDKKMQSGSSWEKWPVWTKNNYRMMKSLRY